MSQASSGGLSGTVIDESGGVLANAQITVEDESTGAVRTVHTDPGGPLFGGATPPGRLQNHGETSGLSDHGAPGNCYLRKP